MRYSLGFFLSALVAGGFLFLAPLGVLLFALFLLFIGKWYDCLFIEGGGLKLNDSYISYYLLVLFVGNLVFMLFVCWFEVNNVAMLSIASVVFSSVFYLTTKKKLFMSIQHESREACRNAFGLCMILLLVTSWGVYVWTSSFVVVSVWPISLGTANLFDINGPVGEAIGLSMISMVCGFSLSGFLSCSYALWRRKMRGEGL